MDNCDWCGEKFDPTQHSTGKFCSEDCYGSWCSENRTGKNHPAWNGGKVSYNCEYCGERVEKYPSQAGRFCSQSCSSKVTTPFSSGEDNPRYSGGSSGNFTEAIRYKLSDWDSASEECRKKADYQCEMCNKSESEAVRLNAHHIVPVVSGGPNCQENLMCVCSECHPRVEVVSRSLTGNHINNET